MFTDEKKFVIFTHMTEYQKTSQMTLLKPVVKIINVYQIYLCGMNKIRRE